MEKSTTHFNEVWKIIMNNSEEDAISILQNKIQKGELPNRLYDLPRGIDKCDFFRLIDTLIEHEDKLKVIKFIIELSPEITTKELQLPFHSAVTHDADNVARYLYSLGVRVEEFYTLIGTIENGNIELFLHITDQEMIKKYKQKLEQEVNEALEWAENDTKVKDGCIKFKQILKTI